MRGKEEIIEVIISRLDLYVIDRVKKLREQRGISQADLSVKMGFSEKFVGSVENPRLPAKYNIRHLNLLARALGCQFSELLPSKSFEDDLVKVKVKRKRVLSSTGTPSSKYEIEIISISPYSL